MATIDLGKIKLVWRGTYSGGTAYTVDDVVQHTDSGLTSSFICTTNSTGNAPSTGGSVHGSWAYLAKGGVAGTDVGTTLTTQGDVLYRDGSGLQRLAKGTAGQALIMNTAANAPEWGAASAGKILKVYNDTDASNISTNSTSYSDTGLSITLTPTSASNDFLIIADLGVTRHASTGASMYVQIMRDSTAVVAHGNGYMGYSGNTNDRGYYPCFFHHLDVPNSTSSITYKIQYKSESSGQTVHSYGSRRMTIFEIDGGIE